MFKSKIAFLFFTITLFLGICIGVITEDFVGAAGGNSYLKLRIFSEVYDTLMKEYVEELDPEPLIYDAIKGMLSNLDPHTNFLDNKDYDELKIETKGSFGGLGIVISIRENVLTVISPMEGTPAYDMGIKAGDKIISIDGESTRGITTTEAVQKLRGPKGTQVTITILREGIDKPLDYTITRDIIEIKSIPFADILSNHIGYIRLVNFSENSTEELKAKISGFNSQAINGLIIDLRNNSGGLLEQAIQVSNIFLEKDKLIVSTRGRNKEKDEEYFSSNPRLTGDYPLIVLVNGGTASASEIVSGAIQDWDHGVILGSVTYGKGSVQTVRSLSGGTALKITVAKYYTPSGRCIHRPEKKIKDIKISEKTLEDSLSVGDEFNKQESENENKEKFYTGSGRIVYGGGGITPDLTIQGKDITKLLIDILRKDLIFKFVVKYLSREDNKKFSKDWQPD